MSIFIVALILQYWIAVGVGIYFYLQAIPGPGKYNIRGQFDSRAPVVNTEGIEVEHPPFMSQAKVSFVLLEYFILSSCLKLVWSKDIFNV